MDAPVLFLCKGGKGSGNFHHQGRPGHVGGSGVAPKPALDLNRQVRITPLPLPGWSGSIKELATLARKVYGKTLQGKSINNLDSNTRIAFTAEGKGEAFFGVKQPVDAQIVLALTRLVRRAVVIDHEAPDERRQHDTAAFHTLVAPLRVGDAVMTVKLTVREAASGPEDVPRWKFYDVAVLKDSAKEKARLGLGLDTAAEAAAGHPTHTGLSMSLGQLLDALKGDNERHLPEAMKSMILFKADAKPKKRRICMTKEEFLAEHRRLLAVLRSRDHGDDMEEAEEQAEEVRRAVESE